MATVVRDCLIVAVTNLAGGQPLIEYLPAGDLTGPAETAILVNNEGIDVNALIFAGRQDLTFDGFRIVQMAPSRPLMRRSDHPGWRG